MELCVCVCLPQPPGKDPSQTSQTSLEADHSPEQEVPVKVPQGNGKTPSEADEEDEDDDEAKKTDERLPDDGSGEGERMIGGVEVPEKPASEMSVKTSSSDSGIEDGKSTPTSEEGKTVDSPEPEVPPSARPRVPTVVSESRGSDSPTSPSDGGLPLMLQAVTLNGSAGKVVEETSFADSPSIMEDTESLAPHANGRLSKRSSNASSVDLNLNLSGDMGSISKEMGSVSGRVSVLAGPRAHVCVCVCERRRFEV